MLARARTRRSAKSSFGVVSFCVLRRHSIHFALGVTITWGKDIITKRRDDGGEKGAFCFFDFAHNGAHLMKNKTMTAVGHGWSIGAFLSIYTRRLAGAREKRQGDTGKKAT